MGVTLSTELKARKLGKRSISFVAADTKGVSGPPARRTINVLGRIVTKEPLQDALDVKPLDPAGVRPGPEAWSLRSYAA